MTSPLKLKDSCSLEKNAMTNLDSVLKTRDITFPIKVHLVKAVIFPVVIYGCWKLDHKEDWVPKNLCFWAVVWEKTLESPLDSKEIKSVNLKGNKSWIFIIRIDAQAEVSALWPPDAKSQFIGKDPDAGKDWRQDRKGMTEDEMAGWHHWLNGQEFDLALGDGEGQGNLACCSPWGRKELDTTEWLNNDNNCSLKSKQASQILY